MKQLFKIARIAAAATLLAASVGAAQAAGYCNAGTATSPLAVGDVTFNTVAANDCYGVVDLANQDPSTITTFANTTGLWTPAPWTFITRDDQTSGNSGVGTLGGYSFTIAADNSQSIGTWVLTVTGSPIPFIMDFVVYLHAGSNSAYYFFDNRQIEASNDGTFKISFTAGGQSTSNPGLSGLTVLGRDITTCCDTPKVPEPASLALLGLSLSGLALIRRRRRVV